MNTKRTHLDYIQQAGEFKLNCKTDIFSTEELNILRKYGYWFEALVSQKLLPLNKAQERFIEVAKGAKKAESSHEKAWWMYQKRLEIERKLGDRLDNQYTWQSGDTFYNREMAKKMRRTMFSVMNETHRS